MFAPVLLYSQRQYINAAYCDKLFTGYPPSLPMPRLNDMLGNVTEWTLNHYDEKSMEKLADKSVDPAATVVKSRYPKTLRGGSYLDDATALRCANRFASEPSWNRRDPQVPKSKWWLTDAGFVGFRIIRPVQQPTKEQADAFFKEYLGN